MRAGNITPSRIESEALYEVSLVFVIVVFLGNTGRDRTEIGCFLRSGTTLNLEPHIVIVKVLQESRTQCFGRFAEYGSDVCVCVVFYVSFVLWGRLQAQILQLRLLTFLQGLLLHPTILGTLGLKV